MAAPLTSVLRGNRPSIKVEVWQNSTLCTAQLYPEYSIVKDSNADLHSTLFRNESITDINYPEVLTAFYHYIIYMHIKKAYKN